MRVIGFQLLVDAYNDVPYTDALKGSDNLTPTYTDGKTIYKSFLINKKLNKTTSLLNN